MDLIGKLIFKVRLGNDIRRIPIHNEDITYDELVLMMQRVFHKQIKTTDQIIIKYQDEDGDLVTISDSADLLYGISCNRVLKLTLYLNEAASVMNLKDTVAVQNQLQMIRNQLNYLLDTINIESPVTLQTGEVPSKVKIEKSDNDVNIIGSTEFDPLRTQQIQQTVMSDTDDRAHASLDKSDTTFPCINAVQLHGNSNSSQLTQSSINSVFTVASISQSEHVNYTYNNVNVPTSNYVLNNMIMNPTALNQNSNQKLNGQPGNQTQIETGPGEAYAHPLHDHPSTYRQEINATGQASLTSNYYQPLPSSFHIRPPTYSLNSTNYSTEYKPTQHPYSHD